MRRRGLRPAFSMRFSLALPAWMRRREDRLQQTLPGDLPVPPEIQVAIVREDLLAVCAPVSRNLPPRHLREDVMHRMQVVVEEEQAPEQVGLGDGRALARPLAVAVLRKGAHPAQA